MSRLPPPALERLGRLIARTGLDEKLAELDLEVIGNPVEQIYGWVLAPVLKPAEVCTVDSCVGGEPLLRNAGSDPQPAEIPRYELPAMHGRKEHRSRRSNHWP